MHISDLSLYDFFREKLNLSDSDARDCLKEVLLKEEKLTSGLKQNIIKETKQDDYTIKRYFEDMEVRIEKGFRQLIIVIIGLMLAFAAVVIAIIKIFYFVQF